MRGAHLYTGVAATINAKIIRHAISLSHCQIVMTYCNEAHVSS
jgi:hypothetical protein